MDAPHRAHAKLTGGEVRTILPGMMLEATVAFLRAHNPPD
jgi:hypothetical protein